MMGKGWLRYIELVEQPAGADFALLCNMLYYL